MNFRKPILILCFCFAALLMEATDFVQPIFQSEKELEITVRLPLAKLNKDVGEDRVYHDGQLEYKLKDGRVKTLRVQFRTRGNTRRNPRLCNSPPLTLLFNPEDTPGTLFREQVKMKLVTQCKYNKPIFKNYLFREYLCYKLFNQFTHISFRVRLMKINYIDSDKKKKRYTRYGFLIESKENVARRLGGRIDDTRLKFWYFKKKEHQILGSLFQFMIGHTDWSIPGRHNIKIIRIGKTGNLYALPYDFDLSGVTYTHYATPHEDLRNKIQSVRSRLYRGLCRPLEELQPVLDTVISNKDKVLDYIKKYKYLKSRTRKSTLRYIQQFYKIIENPRQVKKHFLDNCKKVPAVLRKAAG